MHSPTVEQYVKTIFLLQRHDRAATVGMKTLSNAMNVTPGTATTMAKQLDARGLIHYEPRRGTRLTDDGHALAVALIRRHRLLETFLEKVLEYDWSEVHGEAEELEHAVSDRFIERIDRLLGYPTVDPHGDPIPTAEGVLARRSGIALDAVQAGRTVMVARLTDDSPRFLQLMKSLGVVPGALLRVVTNSSDAGTITVNTDPDTETESQPFVLALDVAARVLVRQPPVPHER